MIIAQISDLHVKLPGRLAYGVVDTAAALRRAVETLNRLSPAPDVVVVTGDLVDFGRPDEYAHLRELLRPLAQPFYLIPGNHDERGALREAFADAGYFPQQGDYLHYTVEHHPVRLVALDTVVPGESGGAMDDQRLEWLDRQLATAPDRPTVVLMHHPPFRTGIVHMDEIGLAGADRFAGIIERHRQVQRVLCGHLHRPIQFLLAGTTIASTCPGTSHQVALDLQPDGPSAFMLEPPGYYLHTWRPDCGIVSHLGVIGDFAGPYPFFADGALID